MKKFSIAALLPALFASVYGNPLYTGYKHSVIIDTDCAIDNLRAISMLLSLPSVTIKAIMVSDGSLAPAEGIQKVRSLLRMFNADTIPVMCGLTIIEPMQPCIYKTKKARNRSQLSYLYTNYYWLIEANTV